MRGIYGMGENIMKFSVLADILVKAKMVTDVTISEDCEIEDLKRCWTGYRRCSWAASLRTKFRRNCPLLACC